MVEIIRVQAIDGTWETLRRDALRTRRPRAAPPNRSALKTLV